MATFLLILGVVLMLAALVFAFKPILPAPLLAYAGLWAFKGWAGVYIDPNALIFWGIATAIAVGLDYLLPKKITRSSGLRRYITLGAFTGMIVGLLLSEMAGVILCAVAGAFLGCLAFSRTPAGEAIYFPSRGFLNYLAAIGLPVVVTMSMIGLAVFEVLIWGDVLIKF